MPDYTKATGSTGTMMIRDTGLRVEFWLKAGSATFHNQLPWAYWANGGPSAWMQFRFASGGAWQHLGSVDVKTTGDVALHLGPTGTSGLGGPTDFGVQIIREQVPGPPGPVRFSNVQPTNLMAMFDDGLNRGFAIDIREIWWSDTTSPIWHLQNTPGNPGMFYIDNFLPGQKYNFWGKTHNAKGWSELGPMSPITMPSVPPAPAPPELSATTQTSITATTRSLGDGGSPITSLQIGYSTAVDGVYTWATTTGTLTFRSLEPGVRYFFRARAANKWGWSPNSTSRTDRMQYGARVKDGLTYRPAVPYVRVNGIWRPVEPWARIAGEWRKSTS